MVQMRGAEWLGAPEVMQQTACQSQLSEKGTAREAVGNRHYSGVQETCLSKHGSISDVANIPTDWASIWKLCHAKMPCQKTKFAGLGGAWGFGRQQDNLNRR